jgi:hypothetical protein
MIGQSSLSYPVPPDAKFIIVIVQRIMPRSSRAG